MVTMTGFASMMTQILTAIEGNYEAAAAPVASDPGTTGLPLTDAVRSMGLKLEAPRAPAERLVVDHAEKKPAENRCGAGTPADAFMPACKIEPRPAASGDTTQLAPPHCTTIFTSLSGMTIIFFTCFPARNGWTLSSARAWRSNSSFGVPKAA